MKRKYLDRVEVWRRDQDADDFGGFLITPTKLGDSWCNITTVSRDKMVAYGLEIPQQAIRIKTRTRSDLDYFVQGVFIKYKSKDWYINSITEINLDGEELDIIATTMQ